MPSCLAQGQAYQKNTELGTRPTSIQGRLTEIDGGQYHGPLSGDLPLQTPFLEGAPSQEMPGEAAVRSWHPHVGQGSDLVMGGFITSSLFPKPAGKRLVTD